MSFRKIFAAGSVALDEIGNGVDAQGVYPHVQPELHYFQNLGDYSWIVIVKIRLMREKPMPEELLGDGIPSPIRSFGIGENNSSILVLLFGVAPNVKVSFGRTDRSLTGRLKPGVLVRGVIHNQLDHHLQTALVSCAQDGLKVVERAVHRMDVHIVGDVVAIVLEG